jgi:hypothetical protein
MSHPDAVDLMAVDTTLAPGPIDGSPPYHRIDISHVVADAGQAAAAEKAREARLDEAHKAMADVDAKVAAGPEAQELSRLQARLDAAKAGAEAVSKKVADLHGRVQQAALDGRDPIPLVKQAATFDDEARRHRLVVTALAPALEAAQAKYLAAHQAAVAEAVAKVRSEAEARERQAREDLYGDVLKHASRVEAERYLLGRLAADQFTRRPTPEPVPAPPAATK